MHGHNYRIGMYANRLANRYRSKQAELGRHGTIDRHIELGIRGAIDRHIELGIRGAIDMPTYIGLAHINKVWLDWVHMHTV